MSGIEKAYKRSLPQAMEKNAKKGYETPTTVVVEVTATGMICQSFKTTDYEFGNLDEK